MNHPSGGLLSERRTGLVSERRPQLDRTSKEAAGRARGQAFATAFDRVPRAAVVTTGSRSIERKRIEHSYR